MKRTESESCHILLVDDDEIACRLLAEVLSDEGYKVDTVRSGQDAVKKTETSFYDLVITDLMMPGIDGLEILKKFKQVSPDTLVIMITAFGSLESAIEAMKAGAFDYVSKPFSEDEIKIVVRRAMMQKRLQKENEQFQRELKMAHGLDQIIGRSRPMMDIYKTVAMVINSTSNVLIQGESGTGKELIARAIHYNSTRSSKPFVVVNCAALPENLLESELFGHVKGAFTGAIISKKGLIEEAEGGTCFLDEIGDMSLPLQAKMLRMIQEKEIRRVGSTEPVYVNVRIVAATNQPLDRKVKEGGFREDLLYRLKVVTITLPPLRERREDIPLLAGYFLKKYTAEAGKDVSGFSPQAMDLLCRYSWSGNVRELQHTIERAVVLTTNTVILPDDLPEQVRYNSYPEDDLPPFKLMPLDELEKLYLMRVLKETGGNKSEAAKILGVDRRTLYRMAERHRLNLTDKEDNSPFEEDPSN
ncbi:MAG: sigma-54-dependent Fis family transcriptional regulator [Nitrospirae bacterium]|nr:sigma-54-dependent Fis family transcriptional regulator [Nitrospirota bacterium]